jgi:hypothetical protein
MTTQQSMILAQIQAHLAAAPTRKARAMRDRQLADYKASLERRERGLPEVMQRFIATLDNTKP